jgi:hypothetical protein
VIFTINLSDPGAAEVSARSFCSQRGREFGVTEEQMPVCISKVHESLVMQIQQLTPDNGHAAPAQ